MGMTIPIIGEQDVRACMLYAEVLTRWSTRSRAKTGVEAKRLNHAEKNYCCKSHSTLAAFAITCSSIQFQRFMICSCALSASSGFRARIRSSSFGFWTRFWKKLKKNEQSVRKRRGKYCADAPRA